MRQRGIAKHDFTIQLHAKGWYAAEVARRWGITATAMVYIAKNPKQWHLDALIGLENRK